MNDDNPTVRIPPPLIVLAGLAAGLALDGRLDDLQLNPTPLVVLGIVTAAAGLLLGLSALSLFHRKGTKPEPWKPSSALVTNGVFRFTRNPMYVGILLLYAGIALMAGGSWSVGPFVAVSMILNFYVVGREEAYLERRFGDAYAVYRDQVRRWI